MAALYVEQTLGIISIPKQKQANYQCSFDLRFFEADSFTTSLTYVPKYGYDVYSEAKAVHISETAGILMVKAIA